MICQLGALGDPEPGEIGRVKMHRVAVGRETQQLVFDVPSAIGGVLTKKRRLKARRLGGSAARRLEIK